MAPTCYPQNHHHSFYVSRRQNRLNRSCLVGFWYCRGLSGRAFSQFFSEFMVKILEMSVLVAASYMVTSTLPSVFSISSPTSTLHHVFFFTRKSASHILHLSTCFSSHFHAQIGLSLCLYYCGHGRLHCSTYHGPNNIRGPCFFLRRHIKNLKPEIVFSFVGFL